MNEKAIEREITDSILRHVYATGTDWSKIRIGIVEAAYAIAQAHEQELKEMEHRYQQGNQMNLDIAGMARLDMEKAQAQVAVMAEALRLAEEYDQLVVNYPGREELEAAKVAAMKARNAALQDAPTVLFSGKAGIRDVQIGGPFVENSIRRCVVVPMEGDPLRDYGMTIVDAIVLEGPNALQEQSKAQEPGGECSVNDGPEPNSEQEESCGT